MHCCYLIFEKKGKISQKKVRLRNPQNHVRVKKAEEKDKERRTKVNRKLIFFDIDGTIIPEDTGVIPESTKEVIKKAKENGNLVFINTGRTFSGITQPIFDLEFNGYVCGCGTHIYF